MQRSDRNVLGSDLQSCSSDPPTGYRRDGYCRNTPGDDGTHVVCSEMTDDFLRFTRSRGNDLTTPGFGFPGLKPGQRWCLCALRWKEAQEAGKAPPVVLEATDERSLRFNALDLYKAHRLS